MIAEVNNVILTPLVSKTLASIQEDGGDTLCEVIDKAIGTILDLKIGNDVDADKLISDISDLRIVACIIRGLVPPKEKGGSNERSINL